MGKNVTQVPFQRLNVSIRHDVSKIFTKADFTSEQVRVLSCVITDVCKATAVPFTPI